MSLPRNEQLVGVVVSLPTFTDVEQRVLLDPLRKHVRWLIEQGLVTEPRGLGQAGVRAQRHS
jgi:hypothetical protein